MIKGSGRWLTWDRQERMLGARGCYGKLLLFTPYGCSSNGIRPLKVTFGEGSDARQPLLLWLDTVQRSARCRVNSNGKFAAESEG